MNGYTHAILAYTFALAGKEEQVESSLQILDQSAIKISKSYLSFLLMGNDLWNKVVTFTKQSYWKPLSKSMFLFLLRFISAPLSLKNIIHFKFPSFSFLLISSQMSKGKETKHSDHVSDNIITCEMTFDHRGLLSEAI
jgi:hypothetical protein